VQVSKTAGQPHELVWTWCLLSVDLGAVNKTAGQPQELVWTNVCGCVFVELGAHRTYWQAPIIVRTNFLQNSVDLGAG
jgi:hypothetical protein